MTSRITDDSRPSLAPVLRLDLLDCLHGLNADYLELLAAEYKFGTCAAQLQYFPQRLHATIASLTAEERLRIARTPYSLFSLRFGDVRFWSTVCRPTNVPLDVRYSPRCSHSLEGPFCEMALIQAWQTARAFPLAARLMYSMGEQVRDCFQAMPLWQVRRLAIDHPSLLMPRWPTNAGFWPDLLAFSLKKDLARLTAVQLLGTQLVAAEITRGNEVGANGQKASVSQGRPSVKECGG